MYVSWRITYIGWWSSSRTIPVVRSNSALSVPERHTVDSLDAAVRDMLNTGGTNLLEIAHELVERPLIERLMIQVAGNQTEAARRLGVSRNTLRKLLTKFGRLS